MKTLYEIELRGCDDSTIFKLEMTEEEHSFLEKVAELVDKSSTYRCMPTMHIEKVEGFDLIKCADEEDMYETRMELFREDITSDYLYEKDGEKGFWLVIKKAGD